MPSNSLRFLQMDNSKEKRMSGIEPNRPSFVVYLLVLALSFTGLAGVSRARIQDIPQNDAPDLEQEKVKKEEKKDDKKDEKKGLPLKSDRKVSFTTDEGTWLSLDVSPDGKTIAFELLGDIYTLPIEGGKAKLIDGGMSFDSQPRFSPDGQWIAFLSDREGSENIWMMRADGSNAKQVSKDSSGEFASPSWSPDGNYVFVSKAAFGIATFEIWMYHVQGGSGVQITKAKPAPNTPRSERHNALGVVASADGKYLYYAMRHGGFSYNAQLPLWQIARRDRKTGDEDVLLQQLESSFRPVLSPDGTQILYVTRYETESGLRVRNLQSGDDRWVKYPVTRDDQESRFTRDLFPGFAFLPDGKEVVYNQDGKIRRLNLATGADTVIPFTAKVSQELGPKLDFPQRVEEGPVKARLIQDPVESPDGKQLAFSVLTHLYTLDLPSGKPRRVTSGNAREFQPAWSPDGKKIVALRGNAYDRENSEFDGGQTANADLIWIPADGGDANLILPARGAGGPHFTHEKDRIYVFTPQGLVSLRFDGTDRRTHLQVKGQGIFYAEEPVSADDVQPSPDGQWVLAHVMNQLYLIAMPVVGGEAPTVNVATASVPVKRLTDIGADYFAWADDGKTICWAVGASLFREPLSAISFEPTKDEKKEAEKKEAEAKDADKSGPDKKDADAKKDEKKDEKKEEKKLKEQEKDVQEIAINLEIPRKTPNGTIVLRGATVVTMKTGKEDEVLKNADIVVENTRINSVGAKGSVPAAAKVFDVSGKPISPGFIDTHAHWTE